MIKVVVLDLCGRKLISVYVVVSHYVLVGTWTEIEQVVRVATTALDLRLTK